MRAAGKIRKSEGPKGPARALRAHRQHHDLTLADVSGRTGLPVSTLSKLENGKATFTYDKLVLVAGGLGIDVQELLASPAASPAPRAVGRRSVSRAGEGETVDSGSYGYAVLAADLLDKQFVPMVGVHHARTLEEFGELIQHPGEEFVFVLEGTLELHTSIYAPVRLEVGDSIYFDSEMGHAYIAAGEGPCRILTICSNPRNR